MTASQSPDRPDGASAAAPTNSEAYWSSRFVTDWEVMDGPAQSRFFYKLALDNLPEWLLVAIRSERLSICDWGCATGEGTDLLAQALQCDIVGVDFSTAAIDVAVARYRNIKFLAVDYLDPSARTQDRYDIVLTSNTLEHFADPWTALNSVAGRADQAVVVLIPYREYARHHEHEATFTEHNIPIQLPRDFSLVHARVLDTRDNVPVFWNGEQILLVYAKTALIQRHRLTLAASEINADPVAPRGAGNPGEELREAGNPGEELRGADNPGEELRRRYDVLRAKRQAHSVRSAVLREALKTSRDENRELRAEKESGAQRTEFLRQALKESTSANIALREQLAESAHALAVFRASRSWRVTAPLRAGGQAARSGRTGAYRLARWIYRATPLPAGAKLRARNLILGPPAHHAEAPAGPLPVSVPVSVPVPAPVHAAGTRDGRAAPTAPVLAPSPPGPPGIADVFVWGIIDWRFRFQRPQHISSGLARRGARVFYFSNNFIDTPEPGYRIERAPGKAPVNIVYLHVPGAPSIYTAAPSPDTAAALTASLGLLVRDIAPKAALSIVEHPFWVELADRVPNRHLIYDMMDHHEGFGDGAEDILELERRIQREADQVIVTSGFLETIARQSNERVAMVRNACEFEHFSVRPSDVYRDPRGRRIIGYYGAIAHWFDSDLVARVAERFPDDLVLLIGADSAGVAEALKRYPNVEFTGEVPYGDLPFYVHAFDVCLFPFKVIPLILATNPVKVYEYLAAGKPVVSVDLPEMTQFEGLVAIGRDHESFVEEVERQLSAPGGEAAVRARQSFAARQTWEDRAETLIAAVAACPRPKISVIVVTYNNLALTDACLRSIDMNTHYSDYEIIVVDNNSQDGTKEYLSQWVALAPNRRIVLNEENRGFAGGNNQGLDIAAGEYFVMLNNDTYVTPGWLGTLVQHLRRHKDLALICPVTNNIGNEARIDIAYGGMAEMEGAALEYTSARLGTIYPIPTAAFFCVALSRALYEKIGPLDESFTVGMFEDDDYCKRVQQAGLTIACAEDVFVHHHHSASFDALGAERKAQLFRTNRAIFERKWGSWTPHRYREPRSAREETGA